MPSVAMPRLSDSMEQATIVRWLKRVGDTVAVGDALVEIETYKATVPYEAESAGILVEIVVAEGDTVALGAELARIGAPGDNGVRAPSAPAPRPVREARAKASPVARRLATEL